MVKFDPSRQRTEIKSILSPINAEKIEIGCSDKAKTGRCGELNRRENELQDMLSGNIKKEKRELGCTNEDKTGQCGELNSELGEFNKMKTAKNNDDKFDYYGNPPEIHTGMYDEKADRYGTTPQIDKPKSFGNFIPDKTTSEPAPKVFESIKPAPGQTPDVNDKQNYFGYNREQPNLNEDPSLIKKNPDGSVTIKEPKDKKAITPPPEHDPKVDEKPNEHFFEI